MAGPVSLSLASRKGICERDRLAGLGGHKRSFLDTDGRCWRPPCRGATSETCPLVSILL